MPELVYDVKFRIDPRSAQQVSQVAAGGATGSGSDVQRTTRLVNDLGEAHENAGDSAVKSGNASKKALKSVGDQAALTSRQMNQLVDAQNKTGRAAARTSKNFSVANQTLFSFSDGIQDAAQFSQGFGVGMRAIGNNVGFTLELLTSLSNRVKEHNALVKAGAIQNGRYMTTFGALGAALSGPGGWLLYLNAAITAITVLTTRSKKAEQEASKLTETLLEQAKAHRELAEAQSLTSDVIEKDSDSIKDNIEFLKSSVQSQRDYIETLENSNQSTIFGISRAKALNAARENLKKTIDDINKAEGEYVQQKIREAITLGLSADASERDFELRKQATEKTREATSVLAQFSDETKITEEALNKAFTEGNNLLAFFRSSSSLTADQVAIAKQLEQALLRIADSFASVSRSMIGVAVFDAEIMRISTITQIFIESERKKREEAKKTAQLQDFYQTKILGNIRAKVPTEQEVSRATQSIHQETEDARVDITRQAVSAISSVYTTLTDSQKGLAFALIAIEKGLRIADVVVNASSSIAKIKAAAAVQQQAGDLSAFARAAKNIALVKASAAVGIAAIIAQGIAQGRQIGGGGGGGASSGVGRSDQFGVSFSDVGGNQNAFRTPDFMPQDGSMQGMSKAVEKGLKSAKFIVGASNRQLYLTVQAGQEAQNDRSVGV